MAASELSSLVGRSVALKFLPNVAPGFSPVKAKNAAEKVCPSLGLVGAIVLRIAALPLPDG